MFPLVAIDDILEKVIDGIFHCLTSIFSCPSWLWHAPKILAEAFDEDWLCWWSSVLFCSFIREEPAMPGLWKSICNSVCDANVGV